MFGLPPPPPIPPQHVYNLNLPGGMATIALDTSNTIGHPSGPEYQLAVGEGSTRSNLATYSIKESERESRSSHDTSSDGITAHLANVAGRTPVFGEDNALLTPALGKDGVKRKKPKTNIVKSNSSFVSRVMPHEAMTKRIQEHNPEGLFAFANINRAFQWLDLSSSNESKAQHIIKILFTKAHMLCHDINLTTKGPSHLDIIMGASTADIMWFEAFSQKYARINKNAVINPSPIYQIRWLPGSENLFLAAHTDGTLIVYDKERDDAAFVPEENGPLIGLAKGSNPEHRPLLVNKSLNSRNQNVDGEGLLEHPVESRTRTAELPPVMNKIIDDDPISWLGFEEDCIITACVNGHIRLWGRPQEAMSATQVEVNS
ncbi:MAG: hypothetical protein LQ346_005655 [Caloplaca aetnensis]|nr:MAG: hypothetical protein LQ346_005655 [Caloplaca aetnensis]